MKVKEICDYSGSTLLGMNGGMVESPDSKRIIYARKADLTKPETEIWICDRNFENHRKVYDVHCGNHNGPSATFITNSLIVFRDVEFEGIAGKEPSICVFRILDVDTGEVKYKIRGKESHCAENGKYPFSISTEYLDKNPGIIKSKIDHSSDNVFSIGVPVSANLCSATTDFTAFAPSEAGFFINCASSINILSYLMSLKKSASFLIRGYVVIHTS